MSIEFFQTRMGHKFFEADVPRIAKALVDIAKELKRANDLKEGENEGVGDSGCAGKDGPAK